jgi:hypothetical protein
VPVSAVAGGTLPPQLIDGGAIEAKAELQAPQHTNPADACPLDAPLAAAEAVTYNQPW